VTWLGTGREAGRFSSKPGGINEALPEGWWLAAHRGPQNGQAKKSPAEPGFSA
jgi:hypothetical protein